MRTAYRRPAQINTNIPTSFPTPPKTDGHTPASFPVPPRTGISSRMGVQNFPVNIASFPLKAKSIKATGRYSSAGSYPKRKVSATTLSPQQAQSNLNELLSQKGIDKNKSQKVQKQLKQLLGFLSA